MRRYKLELNIINVTEFNEDYNDWSGDMFSKGAEFFETYYFEVLTENNIKAAIEDMLFVEYEDYSLEYIDNRVVYSRIENGDAYEDPNGNYLVDYDFIISVETIEDINIEDHFNRIA